MLLRIPFLLHEQCPEILSQQKFQTSSLTFAVLAPIMDMSEKGTNQSAIT